MAKNTTFTRALSTSVGGSSEFLWSTGGNWRLGAPVDGDSVTLNITNLVNPGAYDDIANLTLSTLKLTQGNLAVAGNLTIGTLDLTTSVTLPQIATYTYLSQAPVRLTINNIIGPQNVAFIEATFAGALTYVNMAVEPGEYYEATGGGVVEFAGKLQAASTLDFPNSTFDSGTFAFQNPGAQVAARLLRLATGDSIEVPGSAVTAFTYGSAGFSVVTDAGSVAFTNVTTATGQALYSYTASQDAATGLEKITFQNSNVTSFTRTTAALVGVSSEYLWSNTNNWTNGVPQTGAYVTLNITNLVNPGAYDDIANLTLSTLKLTQGNLAVAGNLTIGTLDLTTSVTLPQIATYTYLSQAPTRLTINNIIGPQNVAFIEATFAGALTYVNMAVEPGEYYEATGGGVVEFAGKLQAASTLDFPNSTFDSGTFAFQNPGASVSASLQRVAAGDVIEIPGSSVIGVTYGANSIDITTNLGAVDFTSVHYAVPVTHGYGAKFDAATGLEAITLACFVRGARIATNRGEIPVEALCVGDHVTTSSGRTRPIVWIGHRAMDLRRHPDPKQAWPIRVQAHAFGEGQPRRDLWLSPGHNIAWDGFLIPISCLINGHTVTQVKQDHVEYWHVELDAHDILLAEAVPAESYLDTGNRTAFVNGGAFTEAYPDFKPKHWAETCLPLALDGPPLVAAKAALLKRLVYAGLTVHSEDGARILVDGVGVEPIRIGETRLAFMLPPGGREVTLISNVFIPAHTVPESGDLRELGLSVRALQIDGFRVALDNDETISGWQRAEFDNVGFTHRWTNGATPLPDSARIVVVELAGLGQYWATHEDENFALPA